MMQLNLETAAVMEKTRELCATLVSQPEFDQLRRQVEAFLADEEAKRQYQLVAEKGEHLHHKQHQGVQLDPEEVSEFERERAVLASNPVAREFFAAQDQMRQLQDAIGRYVARTLELGRVPAAEDFESCGAGCGCHH